MKIGNKKDQNQKILVHYNQLSIHLKLSCIHADVYVFIRLVTVL